MKFIVFDMKGRCLHCGNINNVRDRTTGLEFCNRCEGGRDEINVIVDSKENLDEVKKM